MRKLEQMAQTLNDSFKEHLAAAMAERFDGLRVETRFDFFGSMSYVTTREDGNDFTPEQHAYMDGWGNGYGAALDMVRLADSDSQRRG